MVRVATVGRDLGRMFQAFAVLPAASVLVAVAWREFYAVPALAGTALLAFALGTVLHVACTPAPDPDKLHGMMVAASGWFLVAAFGSLPFLGVAYTQSLGLFGAPPASATTLAFRNPLNAFFESMSGFTGTGLTMAVHEPALPHVLQWWRSFTEWVGGVGVIVLTTAILARPGSGSLTLYESEARSRKIHPSVVSTVRSIWWIFLLFTFAAVALLWLAGMPLWDAINHAMTGLSTGGFSVTDNSIATYDSALVDLALVPVMVAGSIAFPVHYLVLRGDLAALSRDVQTRWVAGFFAAGTLAVTALLFVNGVYATTGPVAVAGVTLTGATADAFQAFRYGVFQFVSAASCAGFQTAGSLGTAWSTLAHLTLVLGMFVGAAAGSTVGGIKMVRAVTLVKGAVHRISGVFYPRSAVRPLRIGERVLSRDDAAREFEEAAIVTVLWAAFVGVGVVVLLLTVPDSFALESVLFEVASAQGNVGLSTGITGPGMPTPAKVVFVFNMWVGRLEIIPVLVLLRVAFDVKGVYSQ